MSDSLEKIDQIRARFNVSYEEAKKVLDAADGDVVQALIALENRGTDWTEKVQVTGGELVNKIRDVIRQGNVRKVVVRQDDRILFELPLTLGAIGAIIAPQLAAVGAIAALVAHCTVEIQHVGDPTEPKV